MYVHVYKKIKRDPLGLCAHFCPFCRCVRAFGVSSIGTVTTLNGIPIGKLVRVSDELKCRSCLTAMGIPIGAARPIASLPDGAESSFEALADAAEQTSPWSFDRLMTRLDLEARVGSGNVTRDDRRWLIAEAFDAIEYSAALGLPGAAAPEGPGMSTSKGTGWLIAGFVIGLVVSAILWAVNIIPGGATVWMWAGTVAASAVTAAMFPWMIVRVIREQREVKRRLVLEPLARALAPLSVTEAEVREEYAARKRAKSKLTLRVKERELLEVIAQGGVRSI